jgi:hypothetical protein
MDLARHSVQHSRRRRYPRSSPERVVQPSRRSMDLAHHALLWQYKKKYSWVTMHYACFAWIPNERCEVLLAWSLLPSSVVAQQRHCTPPLPNPLGQVKINTTRPLQNSVLSNVHLVLLYKQPRKYISRLYEHSNISVKQRQSSSLKQI